MDTSNIFNGLTGKGPNLFGIPLGFMGLNQYMGPNNDMNLGEPKDDIEAISKEHDINYELAKRDPSLIHRADKIMLYRLNKLAKQGKVNNWPKWYLAKYGIQYLRPATGFGADKLRKK